MDKNEIENEIENEILFLKIVGVMLGLVSIKKFDPKVIEERIMQCKNDIDRHKVLLEVEKMLFY